MSNKADKKQRSEKSPNLPSGRVGYGYNRLEGKDREWAKSNRFDRAEYCVPVKDGKKFNGEEWQKIKCGDGRMGFSTRRKGQEEVQMEVGMDGQLKKRRHTLIRPKSARCSAGRRPRRIDGSKCSLICLATVVEAQRDPIQMETQRKEYKKSQRAKNRNGRARRGRRRAGG